MSGPSDTSRLRTSCLNNRKQALAYRAMYTACLSFAFGTPATATTVHEIVAKLANGGNEYAFLKYLYQLELFATYRNSLLWFPPCYRKQIDK